MLRKDFGYALRTLRNTPGFTTIAVLTLALGTGASTAIFSVVNGVLLRPLPYGHPGRLVLAWADLTTRNVTSSPLPPADLHDLRRAGTLFDGLAGVVTAPLSLSDDDGAPEYIYYAGVTTNFFRLLGVHMAAGRDFVATDGVWHPTPPPSPESPANAKTAVTERPPLMTILSYGFWRRRYGGDRSIIGRSINIGRSRAQVVGVLPPGFELLFPPGAGVERRPEVYLALRWNLADGSPTEPRSNASLRVIGRLRSGVTLAQAQAQMDGIAADLRRRFPAKAAAGLHIRLVPMHQDLVADVQPAILALMGAVFFVLLIACANVANLLLARASARAGELAVRAALGGRQSALVRQMLTESLVLALGAALVGLGLAALGIKLLLALAPTDLPRLDAVTIDPMVLAFTVVVGLAACALSGLVPALRASRPDIMSVLRAGGRGTTGQRRGAAMRNGVGIAEVALSFVLLVGAGLMLRSFIALEQVDPGFDPNGVLTFFFRPTHARSRREAAVYIRQLYDRLVTLPSVKAVTAAAPLPLHGQAYPARWSTQQTAADPRDARTANARAVLPGYFRAMGTRLIAGRTFTEADNRPEAKVIVIDQQLAAQAFPHRSAVGQRLLMGVGATPNQWYTVIGVVAHERDESLASTGPPGLYVADGVFGHAVVTQWAVRTAGDPAELAPAVRAVLAQVDRFDPPSEMQPMTTLVDRATAPTRFALALIGVFAVIAAVLATMGLYGVLSTVVRQRTAEIGVRMAFGAPAERIFRLVIGQGLRISVAGLLLGIIGALLLTRVMTSMLVGVAPTDPVTFVSMIVLFLVIAALACWLPARRAAALDPVEALRAD